MLNKFQFHKYMLFVKNAKNIAKTSKMTQINRCNNYIFFDK